MVTAYDTRPAVARGLCTSCRHVGGCVHRGDAEVAVWHCEEFDDGGPSVATALSIAAPLVESPRSSLPGLCGSCAAAATCTFPSRELGVWHCEEFE